jgi:hypothetical protein
MSELYVHCIILYSLKFHTISLNTGGLESLILTLDIVFEWSLAVCLITVEHSPRRTVQCVWGGHFVIIKSEISHRRLTQNCSVCIGLRLGTSLGVDSANTQAAQFRFHYSFLHLLVF